MQEKEKCENIKKQRIKVENIKGGKSKEYN